MIPLFLITEVSEIKNFTSEAKLSNFKQDNHYWLFNHYMNIHFHILTPSPLFQLHLHFRQIHHHKCLRFGSHRSHSYRGPYIVVWVTYIHIGYPNTWTYNSCKISTQLIHQEPASAASVGSKGNHPWLSSHNPHTRRVWHNKRAVIFWLQLSHNLLILNDTTEHHASEVIAVVRVISFLNRISYDELRAGTLR